MCCMQQTYYEVVCAQEEVVLTLFAQVTLSSLSLVNDSTVL